MAQVEEDLPQALVDDRFVPGELVGGELQGQGGVVVGVAQVVEEAGEREDAVAGEEMLPAVAVVGEVDVPDPAGVVEEVEVVDKVGYPRPHVGAVEGQEEV